MDKEPNMRIWGSLADHARDKEQVVIMDPNEIAWLEDGKDSIGVGLIRLLVSRKALVLCRNFGSDILPEEVVEQRPKRYKTSGTAPRSLNQLDLLVLQYPS